MLKPQGFGQWIDPGSDVPLNERDNIACGHCNALVFVKPGFGVTVYLVPHVEGNRILWREEPGAFCRVCMRPVCLHCHEVGTCTPLEALLEQMEGGKARQPMVSLAGRP